MGSGHENDVGLWQHRVQAIGTHEPVNHGSVGKVLGIDADVRNGFSEIRVTFDIDADASAEDIAAVVAQSQKRSAVFDIITNPTNVRVSVA